MNDQKVKWIDLLLIFYVIYCSGTPVATYYYKYYTIINCIIGILFLLLQTKVDKKSTLAIILIIFSIIIAQVINLDIDYTTPIAIFFICVFAYSVSQRVSFADFEYAFSNIMVIISVCSIVLYMVMRIRPDFVFKLPIFQGTSIYPHICYLFFLPAMSHLYPSALTRNEAMFCEMGIYAFMLIFAIIMLMDQNDKKQRLQAIILMISLVTTFSTTGFFAILFLLPELYYRFFRGYKFNMFIICLAFALGYMKKDAIFSILFSKFNSSSGDYGSFLIRFQGTISDIQIFLKNPFGNGITKYMDGGIGSANTVTYMAAVFGIVCSLVVIGGAIMALTCVKGRLFKVMRIMAIAVCFFTQGMTTYPLLYLLTFYGYRRKSIRRSLYENSNGELCEW